MRGGAAGEDRATIIEKRRKTEGRTSEKMGKTLCEHPKHAGRAPERTEPRRSENGKRPRADIQKTEKNAKRTATVSAANPRDRRERCTRGKQMQNGNN